VQRIVKICVLSIIVLLLKNAVAQDIPHNHPELDWYTIETKHFKVHYHDGAERTGKLVAKIAEEIYWPITSLYLYEPDTKIHFIIRDHDDYSNGAAYYYDNKVEIWATPMDFILRGTHNWLRNVVSHEFSNMISLGAARKMPRGIPALYFQYMGYEPEKNPYVLYGFPNEIISYPFAGTIVPMWFAEGVAQFQMPGFNYDTWDTHRDMILRTSILEHELLDYKEMCVFGHNSIRNEKVYNQGYSMTQYIVDSYGLESLRRIIREMKAPWRLTLNSALNKVIGKGEKELHKAWKSYLEKMYAFRINTIKNNLITGRILQNDGSANVFPTWAPAGNMYAFLSNKGNEYLSITSLYVHHVDRERTEKLVDGVNSSVSWSPDGKKIAYSKVSKPNKHFSHYQDVYTYDLASKKERPITRNFRAQSPDWSPDGKTILFVVTKDGTQNIATVHLETKALTYLTNFENGEQVYSPRWSPSGKMIVFSVAKRDNRDIALISADGKKVKYLIEDNTDSRDPVFSVDGSRIYFSWDKSGIFNIYSMDGNGAQIQQLTNVIGGAFMPSVNKNGQVLYSSFSFQKFNVSKLDNPKPIDTNKTEYVEYEHNFHLASANPNESVMPDKNVSNIATQNYDDTQIPAYQSTPYSHSYSKMAFLPRVMIDYGTTKLGSYFYSSDVLNKYSVFGGFAVNKDWDYDIFAMVEYNKWRPTLFLETYYQVRHHLQLDSLIIEDDYVDYRDYTEFGYKYSLMEVDVGARSYIFNDLNRIKLAFIFSRYSAKVNYEIQDQKVSFPYTYFIGKNITLTYDFSNFVETPWFDSEINPHGKRKITLRYSQEFNKFINDFKLTEYGTWGEVYDNYNYSKFELEWREYIGLFANGKHTLNLELQAGAITQPVHEFFNFFAGGLLGLRGYPYYSIEGRKHLVSRTTYRFPVFNHLNFKLLHLYFDRLYAGIFYDYGNSFNEDKVDFSSFKGNYGFELRLDLFSFYSFPTRIFFNAAYGINDFIKTERYSDLELNYGKEWRYYVGLTFGYFN